MNETLLAGSALTLIGLVGYVVGVGTTYPARSLSVTAVMVGVTLAAIGRSNGGDRSA